MIPRGLWDRLSGAEHRVKPQLRRAFVLCGWHPHDPRRNEYQEYLDNAADLDNDPAFEKVSDGGRMLMYNFDHTKVPKKEGTCQVQTIRRRDRMQEHSDEAGPWA